MDSLAEYEVYAEKEGRVLDDAAKPVPDTLSVGLAVLTHGTSTTPLDDFNQQFGSNAPPAANLPAESDEDFSDLPNLAGADDSDEEPEEVTMCDVEFDMDDEPEWFLDDGDRSESDSVDDDTSIDRESKVVQLSLQAKTDACGTQSAHGTKMLITFMAPLFLGAIQSQKQSCQRAHLVFSVFVLYPNSSVAPAVCKRNADPTPPS
ncbi:hypothetical protein DFH09DRAFT_1098801 [Mycena vulgaris]|nr:hypothetical protein DFH09DRAFT_1098801 [Mycena vulgaris]